MKDIKPKVRIKHCRKERRKPVQALPQTRLSLALALYRAEVDTGTRREGGARARKLSLVWRALDGHIVADRGLNPL